MINLGRQTRPGCIDDTLRYLYICIYTSYIIHIYYLYYIYIIYIIYILYIHISIYQCMCQEIGIFVHEQIKINVYL